MFHHGKDGRASFRAKPAVGARPAKPNGPSPLKHEQEHGKEQAPHDAHQHEQHVTKTHPGKTEPHPITGVHAHHVHHTGSHEGGGPAYSTHTHHDDGTVESKDNLSHDDMMADKNEAFPPDNETASNDMVNEGGNDFGEELGGIGGEAV